MKKILVSLLAILFFCASGAFALSIGDGYYLGSIVPSQPADEVAETMYVQTLVDLTPGDNTDVPGAGQGEFNLVTRSANVFTDLPDPIYYDKVNIPEVEPQPNVDFTDVSFAYLLGKYGQDSHVWYVGGLTTFFLPGSIGTGGGLSHYTLFNPQQVPEPATLLLLGAGLAGLAVYRRRSSK